MALDSSAIRCLINEIAPLIINGRIDKIHQPEKDEVVLHIRTIENKFKLVLSASSAHPRLHFTEVSKKNPQTAPMFCMLMRKHIGSAKITAIEQMGFERIVKLSFETYDELGDLTHKHIIVEIMGRHSNVILVDDNLKIIDAIKHIDFTVSSVRQILPGLTYSLPPSQDKIPLVEFCAENDIDFSLPQTADKSLMNAISGISPLTAREIVYSALSETSVHNSQLNLNRQSAIKAEAIRFAQQIEENTFSPCMIREAKSGRILDFSPIEIKQYEASVNLTHYDSMSKLLDDFYGLRDMHERMRQKSADLIKLLNNAIERVSKKIVILERTLKDAEDKEKYKIYGDLLIANIYIIPEGAKSVDVQNYYESDMPTVTIALDESMSPSQNAQRYYKKYNKAKTAETEAAKQLKAAQEDLDYLESTLSALNNSETDSDLNAIRTELAQEGYLKRKTAQKQKKQSQSQPLHFTSPDGFDVYVGKNNTQNDYLTLKLANTSDIWFHTKNIHGSHTVIKLGIDKNVPKETMMFAAQLAAYYSKARNSSQVPVDYTQIKNVKKPNGAKPGMVIYDNYNTVYVTPYSPAENDS